MRHSPITLFATLVITLCARYVSAEAATTKFGVTLGLSGGSAPFSESCKNALTLATEDINASGGVTGKPLELIIEDFGNLDLKRAASAAQKLLTVDRVSVLLTNWSEDTEVIGPIAARARILTMTLGAGGPLATRYSPNLFRATTSDAELAIASARDLRNSGAKKACLITANTNYYQDITKEIVQGWESSGGVVSYAVEIDYDTRDVSSFVTRTKSSGCDAIFMWASPGSLAKLARELKNQKVRGARVIPWFGDAPEVLQELKGDAEQIHLYRWVMADKSFSARYAQRFGMQPMRPAGNCYDGLKRIAEAVNKVGSQQDALAHELLTAPPTTGVTGSFTILPSRERTGETYERMLVKDGAVVADSAGR
jgi:branched-chain amino acid transport system substrate-binding protein